MTAESYHLKWDSHHCYLNSSVATLYKSEKYADVVLYSSSSTGCTANSNNVGISAHRFILSSCSQYFSAIFETSPIANNGVFYIILPPDLSHRAIQILVQYMYVGEATVSNDILSEVLRGGEILKIRGLYRTSSNAMNMPLAQHRPDVSNGTTYSANTTKVSVLNSGATSVRYLMEQQQQQQQQQQQHIRSVANKASVMPKDSPVVIKSPKPLSLMNTSAHITKPSNNIGTISGISVNKKVAIDPDEKCCYNTETIPPPIIMREPSNICNEVNCNNCNCSETPPQTKLQRLLLRRERSQSDEPTSLRRTPLTDRNMERNYVECVANNQMEREDNFRHCEHEIHRSRLQPDQSESTCDYPATEGYGYTASARSKSLTESEVLHIAPTSTLNNQCNFVNIKQEPSEWISSPSHGNSESNLPPAMLHHYKILDFQLNNVKTESSIASHEDRNSILPPDMLDDYDRCYTCDICNKTFDDNSTLLLHFDTHSTITSCPSNFSRTNQTSSSADSSIIKSYVPKKRRRISDTSDGDYVNLQCDLCNTSFETAAEWVRHMNCQHTEVELAMFNSKKDKEQKQNSNAENSIMDNIKKITTISRQTSQRSSSGMLGASSVNTNCNTTNSSVLCFSQQAQAEGCQNENSTDYMKPTLSPA